jgi:hypothetical protein
MNFRSLLLVSTIAVTAGSYATHAAYDPWPTGAPGSPNAAVLTVQGAASGGSPIAVTALTLPLPSGAASAANQTGVQSTPGSPASTAVTVQGNASGLPLPAADVQSAPIAGSVAMTVGTTYSVQRSVGVLATVAGNVTFQFSDNSTLTLPVYPGWQTFPFAATAIVSAGTTAAATYFNLK